MCNSIYKKFCPKDIKSKIYDMCGSILGKVNYIYSHFSKDTKVVVEKYKSTSVATITKTGKGKVKLMGGYCKADSFTCSPVKLGKITIDGVTIADNGDITSGNPTLNLASFGGSSIFAENSQGYYEDYYKELELEFNKSISIDYKCEESRYGLVAMWSLEK